MEPNRGSTILVLGILGIVICQILGIVAWVMANKDIPKMEAGTMDPSGLDTTKAGKICGIIATILLGIGLVFAVIYFVVIALFVGAAATGAASGM